MLPRYTGISPKQSSALINTQSNISRPTGPRCRRRGVDTETRRAAERAFIVASNEFACEQKLTQSPSLIIISVQFAGRN